MNIEKHLKITGNSDVSWKDAIVKAKPATVKGNYIKNVAVASTMGPGIKIDFSQF